MDLSYGADYEIFRKEVQAFLAKNWPPHSDGATSPSRSTKAEQSDRFRGVAIEAGYLARSVPKKYGGGEQPADVLRAAIIHEEFRKVRAPLDVVGLGVGLLVPTLLERGEEYMLAKRWRETGNRTGFSHECSPARRKPAEAGTSRRGAMRSALSRFRRWVSRGNSLSRLSRKSKF